MTRRPRTFAAPPTGRIAVAFLLAVVLAVAIGLRDERSAAPPAVPSLDPVATFSIVAADPATGEVGVAVQSKFFAVGRVVPYAAAGIGAVATQSYANTTYGPRGLGLLGEGRSPAAVIDALVADDPQRELRQVGVVDADGNAATFTGEANLAWAGGRSGADYTVQGNILAGPEVVDSMATTFESTPGDLATRMLAALAAGQAAGGDVRGRQSAALLVVREGAGYGGFDDRLIELRVEDHPTPIAELQRLLDIHHGQVAQDTARALLLEAAAASGSERSALLDDALAAAVTATDLYPTDGWGWMALAEVRVLAGAVAEAGDAGARALEHDPWIKTAVLQGIAGPGPTRAVEAMLDDDTFRRAWEAIEAR